MAVSKDAFSVCVEYVISVVFLFSTTGTVVEGPCVVVDGVVLGLRVLVVVGLLVVVVDGGIVVFWVLTVGA